MTRFLAAIPLLMDALLLCMFLFLVFGMVGVQLFRGRLLNQCMMIETGEFTGQFCGYAKCNVGE